MLFNGVTLSSISQLLLKTKIILGSQKQEMGGWGGGGAAALALRVHPHAPYLYASWKQNVGKLCSWIDVQASGIYHLYIPTKPTE